MKCLILSNTLLVTSSSVAGNWRRWYFLMLWLDLSHESYEMMILSEKNPFQKLLNEKQNIHSIHGRVILWDIRCLIFSFVVIQRKSNNGEKKIVFKSLLSSVLSESIILLIYVHLFLIQMLLMEDFEVFQM